MARLTKFVLVLVSGFGFAVASPSTSQAGVIPWVYDAMFGPVGSLRSGAGYAPMYASSGYRGYGSYGLAYSDYSPMSVAYAPTATVAYGSSYGNNCACNQSASYPQAYGYAQPYYGAPSSGCASGNCSSCTTGSTSNTTGYSGVPTPDPNYSNYSTRDMIERLNERVNRLEHDQEQHGKFLKNKHEDFELPPYTPSSSRRFNESTVPPRKGSGTYRNEELRSEPGRHSDFEKPISPGRRTAPADLPEESGVNKIPLSAPVEINPPAVEQKSTDPKDVPETDPTNKTKEEDVKAQRLQDRTTARAVAPKQRLQQSLNPTKMAVAKSNKKPKKVVLDSSLSGEIARH